MNQRIQYIDIAKGIAILSVVFGHALCYILYGFDRAWTDSKLCQFIYSYHMPLFIFLSGLVSVTDISWSRIPSDIWKRFRVFLIPFVLFGSLYSLLYSGNFDFVFSNYKFGYWYLWVLFALYLINYPFVIMGGVNNDS